MGRFGALAALATALAHCCMTHLILHLTSHTINAHHGSVDPYTMDTRTHATRSHPLPASRLHCTRLLEYTKARSPQPAQRSLAGGSDLHHLMRGVVVRWVCGALSTLHVAGGTAKAHSVEE